MDYGERKCMVCGAIFVALKPASVTCSEKCWKERRKQHHITSYYKRKNYFEKIVAERDALLIENLELKKRLGILPEKKETTKFEKDETGNISRYLPKDERVCGMCGKSYMPTGSRQRFCSIECREKFKREGQ